MRASTLSIVLTAALLTLLGAAPAAAQAGSGWIGISYTTPPAGDWSRVTVRQVLAGSPAESAGISAGDVIVRVNDRIPREPSALRAAAPGDTVRFRIERAGREREIAVVAGRRPAAATLPAPVRQGADTTVVFDRERFLSAVRTSLDSARVHLDSLQLPTFRFERGDSAVVIIQPDGERREIDLRPMRVDSSQIRALRTRMTEMREVSERVRETSERMREGAVRLREGQAAVTRLTLDAGRRSVAGAELAEINPGLATYFDASEGLVVLDVAPDTPAARADLRAGDVIVRAGGSSVRTVRDLRNAVTRAEERRLRLDIVREKRPASLTLRWEE